MTLDIYDLYAFLESKRNSLFAHLEMTHYFSSETVLDWMNTSQKILDLVAGANEEILISSYKMDVASTQFRQLLIGLQILAKRLQRSNKTINCYILLNSRGKIAQVFYRKNSENPLEILQRETLIDGNQYINFHLLFHETVGMGSVMY